MPLQSVIKSTLSYFITFLEIFLLIRIVLSWIPTNINNSLAKYINLTRKYSIILTEPMLSPVRTLLEKSILGGRSYMVDLSPLIVYIILIFLKNFIQ